jgi:hypothetical protein
MTSVLFLPPNFSGDELETAEANNGTALLSPGSVSAVRAESAEDTSSKSGEIGAQAVKAGIASSQRGFERRRSIGSSF